MRLHMRCKACNDYVKTPRSIDILPQEDDIDQTIKSIDDDLCSTCVGRSYNQYSMTADYEFCLQSAKDGLTPPTPTDNK